MDAKQMARELVAEAVQELAEKGKDGSIPGPVIGYLIKKGKIKGSGGGKKKRKKAPAWKKVTKPYGAAFRRLNAYGRSQVRKRYEKESKVRDDARNARRVKEWGKRANHSYDSAADAARWGKDRFGRPLKK